MLKILPIIILSTSQKGYLLLYLLNTMSTTNVIVTGPAKIGHICTQNFALFLNFNLQYLLKYKSYDNELSIPYLQIN